MRTSAATRLTRPWIAAALLAALVLGSLFSLLVGPRSPRLGTSTTGDARLAADVRAGVDPRGYQSLSVGRIADGRATFAGAAARVGAAPTPETPYEMGSITKTFTGSLLADGVERGELRLDDPLSKQLTELAGTAVGELTLRQLATHTAGLPAFPDSMTAGVLLKVVSGENTYDGSTAAMLEATRTTKVTEPGRYRYSNLGMSLLGHAEARAAGVADWPTLATERILTPLRMTHTSFAMSAADIPDGAATPHADNGWPTANWYGPAFAPAGSSTWTTTQDVLTYAGAQLDGSAPGSRALGPLQQIPGGEIGLAWHLREVDGESVTWHNGATGGYRTILALDRDRRQAVVILGNSTRDADRAGLQLAATPAGSPVTTVDRFKMALAGWSWPPVGLALWLSFGYAMLRGRSRLALVSAALSGAAGLLALLAHGPWALVPAYVWGGLVAASLVLAAVGVRRGRDLPTYADRRRVWGWLSLVSALVMVGLVVWTT